MNKSLLFLTFAVTGTLLAGPTIAPTGWDLYLRMGPNSNSGTNSDYVTVGGASGGRFEGTLGTSSTSSANRNINLWCIDAQLYFNPNTSYRANSLGFNEINGEGQLRTGTQQAPSVPWGSGQRDVRYEDVPGYVNNGAYVPATGANDNFLVPLGIALKSDVSDGATFRYRMAAFLLDQYESNASSLGNQVKLAVQNIGQGKYDPRNSTRNQSILRAIWTAMDTEGDSPNQPNLSGDAAFWFNEAAKYVNDNYAESNWTKWRIVSGWSGTTYVRNSGETVQTFLTETPEPSFYGLLGAGLSALAWAARRKKKGATPEV